MPDSTASVYKCLSATPRLRILNLLSASGRLCVCELQALLGEPQVKMSKHLTYLKQAGLVLSEREANWRYYRLPEKPDPLLAANLNFFRQHPDYAEQLANDLQQLEKTPQANCCS